MVNPASPVLSSLGGQSPDNFTLTLLRPDDLLYLRFEFVNLTLNTSTEPAPRLVRTLVGQPAYLIVHLPPQHIAEEVFDEYENGEYENGNLSGLKEPPVGSIIAGPSRLAFKVPDDKQEILFTLQNLMDWKQYEQSVAPNALPPDATIGPGIAEPGPRETAIELPYRLILSPDSAAEWVHSIKAVTYDGYTELWHTRLDTRKDGSVDESGNPTPTVRVIWSPDYKPPEVLLEGPFQTSLTSNQRRQIVGLSADFTLKKYNYQPRPILVERLMLTALGAWMDTRGAWDPSLLSELGFSLEEWRNITTMGRDQYVRVAERGYLFPFGHRASLIIVTERKFQPTPSGELAAYLRQRQFIVVQEPLKDYRILSTAYAYEGREIPFKRVRITTLVTPILDPVPEASQVFWPRVGGQDFLFHMVANDWDEQSSDYALPLLFVRPSTNVSDMQAEYNQPANMFRRRCDLQGKKVAFAVNDSADKPGATTLKTATMNFLAQLEETGLKANSLPPDHPKFLPILETAEVSIPAVDQFLGTSGTAGTTTIKLHPVYLASEFDPLANKGQVFAVIDPTAGSSLLALKFPADKAGGLVTPNMGIDGLSRMLGPVPNVDDIVAGKFKPKDVFKDLDANLLGSIKLSDILKPLDPSGIIAFTPKDFDVANLSPQELNTEIEKLNVKIKVPMLTTRPIYPPGTNLSSVPPPKPKAVETRFLWKPEIHPVEPLFKTQPETQLIIRANLLTPLDESDSTYRIEGKLEKFAIDFLGVMKITFDKLTFLAEKGKKVDVSADGIEVVFQGPLEFVNELKNILPADGFSDPPSLTVGPEGVIANYSLGIPSVGVGVFSLQNIALSSSLSLPFVNKPAGVRFAISERQHPFLVTVALFGGGGFFALAISTKGVEQIEAMIEFGGNISINLGVASGGVYVMAGIYFNMVGSDVKLTGYLRCGGALEVLGIISISVEFYMSLTYDTAQGKVWGQATLTVRVKIAFFSKSVNLTVERKFAGSKGDPTFDELVDETDWETYCNAFA